MRRTNTPNLLTSALPFDQVRSNGCGAQSSSRDRAVYVRTVEARGQEVVDRKVDASRVQLLEDRADTADRVAVRVLDPGSSTSCTPRRFGMPTQPWSSRAATSSVLIPLVRLVCTYPVLEPKEPRIELVWREQSGTRQHVLLVLHLDLVEATEFTGWPGQRRLRRCRASARTRSRSTKNQRRLLESFNHRSGAVSA